MSLSVTVLPGDGVGPEVTDVAVRVLSAACRAEGIDLDTQVRDFGGAAIDAHGAPLPDSTREACLASDAVLLGAVGGPKWDAAAKSGGPRPETGLLALRSAMGLYANLRPSRLFPGLTGASPLRGDIVEGTDILIVRELTGGVYFGDHTEGTDRASDLMPYSRAEVARVALVAIQAARGRSGRVTSVDKANVLATSRLWRTVVDDLAADAPDVAIEHVLVDAMAMHLVTRPASFDVIVTENLFGDILSDELSAIVGSVGLAPSASLGAPGTPGLYEPIHGSAPDIAGAGIANPIGAVLSAAMLLRHSGGREAGAARIERAVERALREGLRTRDLGGDATTADAEAAVMRYL